jgi:hypothetical protein
MLFTVTPPADFNSPFSGVLGLEILTGTVESRLGLGFIYIISLFTFESNIVLSLMTLYLCINTFLPIEKIMRNGSKGGNPNRKPYHPYGLRILYKTINQ